MQHLLLSTTKPYIHVLQNIHRYMRNYDIRLAKKKRQTPKKKPTCPQFLLKTFFIMTSLPPFSATQTGPRPVLLQIEEQFNKRIDEDVGKLVDCFSDIVKVGEVKSMFCNDLSSLTRTIE